MNWKNAVNRTPIQEGDTVMIVRLIADEDEESYIKRLGCTGKIIKYNLDHDKNGLLHKVAFPDGEDVNFYEAEMVKVDG